jgi:adhesin/invasin
VSGTTDLVTIVVTDTTGNAVTGLTNAAFSFAFSGGTSSGTFGTVTETAVLGTYTTLLTGTTAGTASTLTVTVNGTAITTTPAVTVTATVTSGSTDTVTIVAEDANGNAISGLGSSAFSFALSGGTSIGTFGTVTETSKKGTYTATFTATTAGTVSTLTTTVNGVVLNSQPTVRVTTPVTIGARMSNVYFASSNVAVGGTDVLTIVVRDTAGSPVTGLPSSAFSFGFVNGTSRGTFGTVTETSKKGTYTVVFTGTTRGTKSALTVTVNGVILTTRPGITVT